MEYIHTQIPDSCCLINHPQTGSVKVRSGQNERVCECVCVCFLLSSEQEMVKWQPGEVISRLSSCITHKFDCDNNHCQICVCVCVCVSIKTVSRRKQCINSMLVNTPWKKEETNIKENVSSPPKTTSKSPWETCRHLHILVLLPHSFTQLMMQLWQVIKSTSFPPPWMDG